MSGAGDSIEGMTSQKPSVPAPSAAAPAELGAGQQQSLLPDLEQPSAAVQLPPGSAAQEPIAQVLLESPVPHLDRVFDYAVPQELAEQIIPGSRVKVPFSGRAMHALVLRRASSTASRTRLQRIQRLSSAVSLVAPEIFDLAAAVAQRYGGNQSDVLRAAIPQRVARVEREFSALTPPTGAVPETAAAPEREVQRRAELVLAGYGPQGWAARVVELIQQHRQVSESQRQTNQQDGSAPEGVVVVVPDQSDLEQVLQALTEVMEPDQVAVLSSHSGPTARFRSFLRLRYGQLSYAIGTRSAVFAPVQNLRHIMVVEDADPSYREQRAPYQHTREVALIRSAQQGVDLSFLSRSRSVEVQRLVESGWVQDMAPPRAHRRRGTPRIISSADALNTERDGPDTRSRIPPAAYQVAQRGLGHGPVLIQVAAAGYVQAVLCSRCHRRQHCNQCHGPLSMQANYVQTGQLKCRWCGLHQQHQRCPDCGNTGVRAAARGTERSAQEFGRAFPDVPVITSSGSHRIQTISQKPAIVVSTPGVEPIAAEGYSAALLLDGDTQLGREGLDTQLQVLTRWLQAASLVAPASGTAPNAVSSAGPGPVSGAKKPGGEVVVVASASEAVSALVRWDPVAFASRELARRRELGLPPARRLLSISAPAAAAEAFRAAMTLPAGSSWIGPAMLGSGQQRWLLFFSYADAPALSAAVSAARKISSAGVAAEVVKVVFDDTAALDGEWG